MGAVYAAIDTRLERKVAMKVIRPEYAADIAAKERFLREARAAARIKHDNVLTIYEADERNGVAYIAMEFLEGYPLDHYLRMKGSLSIPRILRIAAECAAGLGAAHKLGLVHRDIKPAIFGSRPPTGA
jgi:serine/threonine protein kinase